MVPCAPGTVATLIIVWTIPDHGKLTDVNWCTSELTIVRVGVMLCCRAVSWSFGNMRRASRKVETTLTVTVVSLSATSLKFCVTAKVNQPRFLL